MSRLKFTYSWRAWSVILTAFVIVLCLPACSTKKNTAATRNYQAFLTRYNVYFNGDEHYKETLKDMERDYEDDYSSTLFMHPAEAYTNPKAPQPQGSFTRSIEKAQKAIQLHSIKKRPVKKAGKANDAAYKEWLKRDEYNPFLHNAWMLMGRSQYLNGDFLGAASTFYYIAKHFTWLPNTVTEAKLWQARCYCAMDWLFEAETILTRIKEESLVNNRIKELYNFTYADFYIRSHDNLKAIPYLKEAIKFAGSSQKTRLNFLLGQLYTAEGDNKAAYEAFKKAGSSSNATYRTKFNARIKQSEVFEGADINPEVNALKRMIRYDRNKDYLDQIYYAIGNLYLSRRDTANAIANYILAADKSTRSGIDKAISQLRLGGLYFEQHRYDLAQPCYAEAVPMLPDDYPNLSMLKRRSDVLDELAVYSQNVVLNDSLLRLAAMPEDQRLAVIDKIISDLKKKEKEEAEAAKREEYLAQQEAAGNNLNNSNAPTSFSLNADKSWYFYNTAARNAGRTDFQKRWGSRKLENDWRRRNKATFSLDETVSDDDETDEDSSGEDTDSEEDNKDSEEAAKANDPHYREYYLRQIPSTDSEKTTAEDVIREGLYNSGLILKDKLEDFDAAHEEWQRLMNRYPDNVYRLDVYYNEYLMNIRRDDIAKAEHYRQLILSEFPDSKYAVAMADPNYINNLRQMYERQETLYTQAYADYLENRNKAVHEAYKIMERDYPLSPLMPKFMFINALAYVTENKPEEFGATLKELLERYPETDVSPIASAYLQGLSKGRKLNSGSSNIRGMLWDIRLTGDSTAVSGDEPIDFTLEPNEPHYLVLLFSTDSISPNQLLFDVARHNFSIYMVRDFDLEVMNFGPLGLLLIKGFDNEAELNHYRSLLVRDSGTVLPPGVRPVQISKSNFEKLLRGGGSFDDYFRFLGEETDKSTHEAVLPPDEYPSAEEMYAVPPSSPIELDDDNQPVEMNDETPASSEPASPSENIEQEIIQELDPTPAPERVLSTEPTSEPEPASAPVPTTTPEVPSTPSSEPASLPEITKPQTPAETPAQTSPTPQGSQGAQKSQGSQTPQPTQPQSNPSTPALPDYPIGSEGDDD